MVDSGVNLKASICSEGLFLIFMLDLDVLFCTCDIHNHILVRCVLTLLEHPLAPPPGFDLTGNKVTNTELVF